MNSRIHRICRMAAVAWLLTLATVSPAQPPEDDFANRFDRQDLAIQRGKDSGALTRREVRWLRREQEETRRFMDDLRYQGYPPHEAIRQIEQRLDRLDRRIHELATNNEVAPHFRGDYPPPPPPR